MYGFHSHSIVGTQALRIKLHTLWEGNFQSPKNEVSNDNLIPHQSCVRVSVLEH